MKRLENRILELEGKRSEENGSGRRGEEGGEIADKVKRMERIIEKNEREEKRSNVIIRGIEVRDGKRREAVEGLLEKIGPKIRMEQIKRIGGTAEGGREMMVVKLGNEEQKWEVMGKKRNLKSKKERIMEDWT